MRKPLSQWLRAALRGLTMLPGKVFPIAGFAFFSHQKGGRQGKESCPDSMGSCYALIDIIRNQPFLTMDIVRNLSIGLIR